MKIPTPIKVLIVIGAILWGVFEILQFFNRQYALEGGKNFLKTHNATVESIDCYIPAARIIDQAVKICTFNATQNQIRVLVKNLNFHPINPILLDEDEIDRLYAEFNKQAKIKGVVEPVIRTKLDDRRRSFDIESNSCWTALGLKNRSDLKLYGKFENQDNELGNRFFVFYKKSSMVGCIRFESIGG